jgi:type IX secretion system PorP/SprF family membrane protein
LDWFLEEMTWNMRKVHKYLPVALTIAMTLLLGQRVLAQQDPMYTKYMFNSLTFNPAYAGTSGFLSSTAIVRDQWMTWGNGVNSMNGGAPITYGLNVHSPINDRVGLGGVLSQDRIGSSVSTDLQLSYAYRIPLSDGLQLSAALQGGITHQNFDFSGLNIRNPGDANFDNPGGPVWRPNAGAGLYLYSERFYFGASVPRLFETNIFSERNPIVSETNTEPARTYRHMYIASGAAFPIRGNRDFVFKPSVLIKGVGWLGDFATSSQSVNVVRTPTAFDVDASVLFYQTFWVGASFRGTFDKAFQDNSSHDSADLWAAFFLKNGLRIGIAYDYSLTEIQQFGNGSAELMIGYDMNFSGEKIVTPRYF